MLFLSYIIGLWFTLRTHAAVIWNSEVEEKKTHPTTFLNGSVSHLPIGPQTQSGKQHSASSGGSINRNAIKDTQLYKRILGQSLKQVGLSPTSPEDSRHVSNASGFQNATPYLIPPKSGGGDESIANDNASVKTMQIAGLSEEQNNSLVRQVAEMAATAAAVAARDATNAPRKIYNSAHTATQSASRGNHSKAGSLRDGVEEAVPAEIAAQGDGGGHDAPNWGRLKSSVILLGATVLYAVIAEMLVNTVDVVLESVDIDEKFLGITLFALVPNTTEFLVSCTPPLSPTKTKHLTRMPSPSL